MYAVIETGSKQYRVAPGDIVDIERVQAEEGNTVNLDQVLLVARDNEVSVGTPKVPNALVVAEVVAHLRGPKKIVYKMKRRKGYHKKQGHRQGLTRIKISDIKV